MENSMKTVSLMVLSLVVLCSCFKSDEGKNKIIIINKLVSDNGDVFIDTVALNKNRYRESIEEDLTDSMQLRRYHVDNNPVFTQIIFPRKHYRRSKIFVIDSVKVDTYYVQITEPYKKIGKITFLDGRRVDDAGTLSTEYLVISDSADDNSLIGRIKIETLKANKMDTSRMYIFNK